MTRIIETRLKCPSCKQKFMSTTWMSTNTGGSLLTDFRQRAIGAQPLPLSIHTCHSCGYSGFEADFKNRKVKKHLKTLIRQIITPHIKKEKPFPGRQYEYAARQYEFAAWIAKWRGDPYQDVGDLYLKAAWCCYEERRKEEEMFYRQKAIEHFIGALEKNDIPLKKVALCTYLIGELYRRVNEEKKAALWFDRVIQIVGQDEENKRLIDLATQQKLNPKECIRDEGDLNDHPPSFL